MPSLGSVNFNEPDVIFDFGVWKILVTLAAFALSSDSSRNIRCRMNGL